MLDRDVVREFLHEELPWRGIEVPADVSEDTIVETFSRYVEDDTYEWLRDNFKSFFDHGNPDWGWIRGRIERYSSQ
jgi:hypothetical protein